MKVDKKIKLNLVGIKEITIPGNYSDVKGGEFHISESKIKGVKILMYTCNGLYVYRLTY